MTGPGPYAPVYSGRRRTEELDRRLPALDLFFDRRALAAVLGTQAYVDHLRHKPGISAIGRLNLPGLAPRWIASYHPDASAKVAKILAYASQLDDLSGRRSVLTPPSVEQWRIPGHPEHLILTGPWEADRKLGRALKPLADHGIIDPCGESAALVLNYNPFRRVVFAFDTRGGQRTVCKATTTHSSGTAALVRRLSAAGVPLVAPYSPGDQPAGIFASHHARYFPWVDGGNLADLLLVENAEGHTAPEAHPAFRTGEALALLHAQRPSADTPASGPLLSPIPSTVQSLAHLLPEQASRLERIGARLAPLLAAAGADSVIHGDFSADQVLVAEHGVRLIDFDRVRTGPGIADLASFAAVELLSIAPGIPGSAGRLANLPTTAAMLAGYLHSGRTFSEVELNIWASHYLLGRLSEPFRDCAPHWRAEIARRMECIEELLW